MGHLKNYFKKRCHMTTSRWSGQKKCIIFLASLNLNFLKVRCLKLTTFIRWNFQILAFYGFFIDKATNIGLHGYFLDKYITSYFSYQIEFTWDFDIAIGVFWHKKSIGDGCFMEKLWFHNKIWLWNSKISFFERKRYFSFLYLFPVNRYRATIIIYEKLILCRCCYMYNMLGLSFN